MIEKYKFTIILKGKEFAEIVDFEFAADISDSEKQAIVESEFKIWVSENIETSFEQIN